jgi:phage anti-repressor protein
VSKLSVWLCIETENLTEIIAQHYKEVICYTNEKDSYVSQQCCKQIMSTIWNNFHDKCVVSLDRVSEWFEIPKNVLYRTLKQNPYYKEDVDFFYVKHAKNPNKKIYRANNYKHILITPDCFKHLAMQSHSRQGRIVRSYLIDLMQSV